MELEKLTIAKTHQGLIKKEFSALELAKAYFDQIKKIDKKIYSFLTLTEDLALTQAKRIDDLIAQNREIPILAGIPTAIKDNILIEGIRCTAGSKVLQNYIATYDATVIKKLKAQGVVFLGKTNMDEFAMGSSGENSAFGNAKNPHDLAKVAGGSSSGSAAAVAANLCCFALGSDTGGSIRLPASFCGVVGLAPTYGAVSRHGLIAMASSLDQIGPLSKTVDDIRIVFETIFGKDPLDSTSIITKPYYRRKKIKLFETKIGVPKQYFIKGTQREVEKAVKEAIKKFEDRGVKIQEISLPHTDYALATYYLIMPSEISANLARYDGIKYGYSAKAVQNLMEVYLKSRKEGLGEEVKRRIMLGTYALSAGYFQAYYLKAQKVRTKIKEDFDKAFKKVDLILTPTSPTPAFKIGEKTDPLTMYLSDVFTVPASLAGLPALSLPCGKVKGLPIGLQIIGKPFQENKILQAGQIFEKT